MSDINQFAISEEGVQKLLLKSNPQKIKGPDMIPAQLLKECSDALAPILTINFNKFLLSETVPDYCKIANVSAVFKKGHCYNPATYQTDLPLLQNVGEYHRKQYPEACRQAQYTMPGEAVSGSTMAYRQTWLSWTFLGY